MIERVARAICEQQGRNPDERTGLVLTSNPVQRPTYLDYALPLAIAAVTAMREPDNEMIEKGWIDKEDVNPDDIWRAMIDEALK